MKKLPSKVAHNRPPTFFFNTGRVAQTAQKQKSRTPKSPLMQDWVFRHKKLVHVGAMAQKFVKQLSGFVRCIPWMIPIFTSTGAHCIHW
jgi:hypothetical protein